MTSCRVDVVIAGMIRDVGKVNMDYSMDYRSLEMPEIC